MWISAVIDIGNEQLVPLHEVPRLLPTRGNGKRIHISAVYRWAQRGVRGTRLEVIRVGGTTYTSREALQRFAAQPTEPFQAAKPKTAGRERQIDSALQRLDGFLYGSRGRARQRALQRMEKAPADEGGG
jgi:hypothetical protein